MKTRTPKVVPLKVPLNILPMWLLCSLKGSFNRDPKTQGYNLKGPR